MTIHATTHTWVRHSQLVARLVTVAVCLAALSSIALADPLNPLDFPTLGSVTIASGAYTIDTGPAAPTLTGPISLSGTVSASGVAVFRFDDLTVDAGAVITVTGGTGTRPVALLASGSLTFTGTIDANGAAGSAGGLFVGFGGSGGAGSGGIGGGGGSGSAGVAQAGGVGGGVGAGGGGGGGNPPGGEGGGGGGGGGFGGAGRIGRSGGNFGGNGGVGGAAIGVQPNFLLWGGSGGGGGGGVGASGIAGGGGGGGGGAVELGALGTLDLTGGTVNANGGNSTGFHDGGGGSGGAVLVHGGVVALNCTINATGGLALKGGGGGGGRVAIQATNDPGTTGISVAGGSGPSPPYGSEAGDGGVITISQPVLTPTTLDFGSIAAGTTLTLGMIVKNTGAAGSFINGSFPNASAPFARVGDPVFSGLKQNALTTCEYSFTPPGLGWFSQTLTFLSNAGPVTVTIRGVGEATALSVEDTPREFALSNASSNPSKETFALWFDVASPTVVKLQVLDLQGREVAVLAEGEYKPGRYPINWNGRAGHAALPSGVYFIRYRAGGATFVRRVVLAR